MMLVNTWLIPHAYLLKNSKEGQYNNNNAFQKCIKIRYGLDWSAVHIVRKCIYLLFYYNQPPERRQACDCRLK